MMTPFSVTIDASEFVDDLKKMIKKNNENALKVVDGDELELYIAKNDNRWLNRSDLETVTLDEHGCPDGFEKMDPMSYTSKY
ncbi:hypothetical protein PHMEG_000148 [Phytophthora megakarya]|uniref:Crinkler effector protein N-terminal domain-containing protein n=1 Tax=Phytophthora megakarya TaxID=4795 RepID=A0A225X3P9_9STRA|nr:hypothetical protein PHMEG_000148 [Phytophthora megakarya]